MKLKSKKIFILKFTFIAIIAILFNIGFQYLFLTIFNKDSIEILYIAMILATGFTLLLKFWLDKKYLFEFKFNKLSNMSKKFSLYSINGIFTTILFWIIETIFYLIFENKIMLLFGAFLGLSISYVVKYYLDKKIVFT